MKNISKQIGSALLFLVIGWCACMAYFHATRETAKNSPSRPGGLHGKLETVRAGRAFDGDSGRLADGREYRLVGIDAPEKGEPFADEARALAKKLLEGQEATMEPAVEPVDRYGRMLAWLRIMRDGETLLVNQEIVRLGFAYVYQFRPNAKYRKELVSAQRQARAARRGLWSVPRKNPEDFYFVSYGRTHRPDCGKMLRGKKRKVRYDSFAEAVDTGAPPCRDCKP